VPLAPSLDGCENILPGFSGKVAAELDLFERFVEQLGGCPAFRVVLINSETEFVLDQFRRCRVRRVPDGPKQAIQLWIILVSFEFSTDGSVDSPAQIASEHRAGIIKFIHVASISLLNISYHG